MRFEYVFKGWGGVVQNNLKIGYLHADIPVICHFYCFFPILIITNLSYVRILLLLSLTVILLKMYVEAHKTSMKLNVKSKVAFFPRYCAFFPCLSSQFACCYFLSSYDG